MMKKKKKNNKQSEHQRLKRTHTHPPQLKRTKKSSTCDVYMKYCSVEQILEWTKLTRQWVPSCEYEDDWHGLCSFECTHFHHFTWIWWRKPAPNITK